MFAKKFVSLIVLLSLLLAACSQVTTPAAPESPQETQPSAETGGAGTDATAAVAEAPAAAETPAGDEPTTAAEAPSGAQPTAADQPTEAAALPGSGAAQPPTSGQTLQQVMDRGQLVCGVHGQFQGFGFLDSDGSWTGFDVDFCRAIAAAVLGDADAVEFRGLSAQARFTALQSGEVDVLIRNSTWTLIRDVELGLTWGPVTFYDGQAIMVRRDLVDDPAADLTALEGANVCVQSGTTTELNLADQMRAAGVNYSPVVFEDQNAAFQAYEEGRCDGITSDRSQLATQGQAVLTNYDDHIILDVVMSKEPLGVAVRQGDDQWADVVHWVVFGMIEAEELGITSENVGEFTASEDPVVRRLLGGEGEMGAKLTLPNDFMVQVIEQVGNYGEVYERNLSPYGLTRGLNDLWTNGGLMYAMPFR